MNSTLAPSPWPAPAPAPTAGLALRARAAHVQRQCRRCGRAVAAGAQLLVHAGQLLGVFVALCVLLAGHRRGFLVAGRAGRAAVRRRSSCCWSAPRFWVCCAPCRATRETITLAERELTVEHRFGRRRRHSRLPRRMGAGRAGARRRLAGRDLSGKGQRMRVGRYLRPELRTALARELRRPCARMPHARWRKHCNWNRNDDDDELEHMAPACAAQRQRAGCMGDVRSRMGPVGNLPGGPAVQPARPARRR